MRQYICDKCGDVDEHFINVLEIPCHHWSHAGDGFLGNYQDGQGNSVSGKRDKIDLCNACWNIVWSNVSQVLKGEE